MKKIMRVGIRRDGNKGDLNGNNVFWRDEGKYEMVEGGLLYRYRDKV